MRERSRRCAIATTAFFGVVAVPFSAHADPCSDGTDALNLARRARKTFYDFAAIERTYTLDKELSYAAIAAGETYYAKADPTTSSAPDEPKKALPPALHTFVNGAAFFGAEAIPGYQLCTPAGNQKEPVTFLRGGFIAGVDDIPSKLSAELAVVFSSATGEHDVNPPFPILPSAKKGALPQTVSVEDFSISQTLFAASARYGEWVQGTVGWLTREHTEIASNVIAPPDAGDPGNHLIGAIGVPGLNLTQTLIIGTTSRPIETYALDFDHFPIPRTRFDVTAALAYLDDERQTYSVVGGGYGLKNFGPHVGVDGAVEYNDPRFRYARIRGDLGGGKVLPWFYVGAGLFLAVSVFNSRYLYEQTSRQMAPGVEFGARSQFSSGPFAFGCEISVSTNRPELMSLFVQSVDSVAATASAFLRISPPI